MKKAKKFYVVVSTFVVIVFIFYIILAPAFHAVRKSQHQVMCKQYMHNLALFIHADRDAQKQEISPFFGNWDETEDYWSWRIVALRSHDIGGDIFERLNFYEPWNSERNLPLLENVRRLEYFTCPCEMEGGEKQATYVAVTGPGSVWTELHNGTIEYNYEVGNMILVIETTEPKNHWAEPGDNISPESVIRLFESDPGLVKNSSKKSVSSYSHWPKHFVRLNGTTGRFDEFPDVDALKQALIITSLTGDKALTEDKKLTDGHSPLAPRREKW